MYKIRDNKLTVIIDTCTLIKCYRNKNLSKFSKILRKNNFQIVLTDVVLHELCKVLNGTYKFVVIKILKYFQNFKIIDLGVMVRCEKHEHIWASASGKGINLPPSFFH